MVEALTWTKNLWPFNITTSICLETKSFLEWLVARSKTFGWFSDITKNSGPTQRFVAGLGLIEISARGFTILYSLEGFLCGAFRFIPVLKLKTQHYFSISSALWGQSFYDGDDVVSIFPIPTISRGLRLRII